MERSYEIAIRHLNDRKAPAKPSLAEMRGSDDMVKWLELLGHSLEVLDRLNVIHVAGTNGKGSTCAFAASFLKVQGGGTRKVGLYTSPHMKSIRERIRIDGEPISKEQFTTRFFEVWDKLPTHATPDLDIPRYLQFLALLSFHIFVVEGVDVAIYETHLGGEYDATNILARPLVTVITPIALDHVQILGPAIEDIAWHKAGILKTGSLAFSAPQVEEVVIVLQRRADERNVALKFVTVDAALPTDARVLKPMFQRVNCSLALAAARAWLSVKAKGQTITGEEVTDGIRQFSWPGRYQQIDDHNCQWFLDGAHNESALTHTASWFVDAVTAERRREAMAPIRILIFSHFSARDGTVLLRSIAKAFERNDFRVNYVIFTTYDERRDGETRIDRNLKGRFSPKIQDQYASFWGALDPGATILCERTIEEALDQARKIGDQNNGMQALITGSLHLVSGALCLLEPEQ